VGYDNSINKLIAATRVNITNEVITVSAYGTLVVGTLEGSDANITGNVNAGNLITTGIVSSTGNVVSGNVTTGGRITATGNIVGGNISTAGLITVAGNVIGGNIATVGTATATQFNGSGAGLTSINGSNISSGTIPSARLSGSYSISITGSAGSASTATSATTAGTVTTGSQPNITSLSTVTVTSLNTNGGALRIPTAASDPAGGELGSFYFNTSLLRLRLFTGNIWLSV
jgi:hypothetical protein